MLYTEKKMDLFNVPGEYYLAHCISADFGMGKGIVVEFNKRYDMKSRLVSKYSNYLSTYRERKLGGDCILEGRVFNLITKERYYQKPTMYAMRSALDRMKEICINRNITMIAMPTIGAGLDRLPWENVSELIQEVFKDTEIEILICKR